MFQSVAAVREFRELERTATRTATKTSLESVTLGSFYYFAIIPIRSACTLLAGVCGN